ncbi:UNVERIFIED_CONTAM: Proprotein convertase subtilisin/kexin type 6 [Gekko kuhli]
MWYMHCEDNDSDCRSEMNVLAAWRRGYTGRDVVVTILDDGIEKQHPDLIQNYDPRASYDVNGGDEDPSPRYDNSNENKHGTRCAGEVAAAANNSNCVVGIAYNARIGGKDISLWLLVLSPTLDSQLPCSLSNSLPALATETVAARLLTLCLQRIVANGSHRF